MRLRIDRRAHLLRQERTKPGTVRIIHTDIGTPLGNMMRRILGHATGHAGHEPGGTMLGLFNVLRGRKGIVALGQGVLDVVASAESLDSENVVQVEALVAGDCGGWGRRVSV